MALNNLRVSQLPESGGSTGVPFIDITTHLAQNAVGANTTLDVAFNLPAGQPDLIPGSLAVVGPPAVVAINGDGVVAKLMSPAAFDAGGGITSAKVTAAGVITCTFVNSSAAPYPAGAPGTDYVMRFWILR